MSEIPDEVPSVLALDVGNTSVHFAHVRGEAVTPMRSVPLKSAGSLAEELRVVWEAIPPPRKVAASSVNASGLETVEVAVLQATGQGVLVVLSDDVGQLRPSPPGHAEEGEHGHQEGRGERGGVPSVQGHRGVYGRTEPEQRSLIL